MSKAFVLACSIAALLPAQDSGPFTPARYRSGAVPSVSVAAVGGGQVFVELSVDSSGRVTAVTPLRTTPPFTDLVVNAIRDWSFVPAIETVTSENGESVARLPVASKVLVAAVFRQPALSGPTLGEPPRDAASPSDETPFPMSLAMPPYPPFARDSGVVLLEARVDVTGSVVAVTVIRSAPPFDAAARAAIEQWHFRPGRHGQIAVPTRVYVLVGFPAPIGMIPTNRD